MKVLNVLTRMYLALRVKNANKLGSIDASGKVVF